MTIRTTFALDPATGNAIDRLAKLWKVSKAEAVRRSIAEAERQAAAANAMSPLEALDWLQSHGTLTDAAAARWEKDSRKGWEEAWRKKGIAAAAAKPRRTP